MFTSLVCELCCHTCILAAMDRRALINQRCDSWRVGVHSMAPVGAWLPWAEVLTLAGRCGWSEFDCQAATETWTSLSGAELTWTDDHSSILRVRLLPLDKNDGVLDLSDDEEIPSAHLEISDTEEVCSPVVTHANSQPVDRQTSLGSFVRGQRRYHVQIFGLAQRLDDSGNGLPCTRVSAVLGSTPLFEESPPCKTRCKCVRVVACKASTRPSVTLSFPTGLEFIPPSPTHYVYHIWHVSHGGRGATSRCSEGAGNLPYKHILAP